jgi:hypothetical protein
MKWGKTGRARSESPTGGGSDLPKSPRRGRPRSENPMVHTAVVLPRNLLEWLKADGERSARGLSTEIRQRLVATYGEGLRDPEMTELVKFIQMLGDSLGRDVGKWHENETAKAAFIAGLLEFLRPEPVDRFQSFAERYVIARAPTFKPEAEREEAWRAILDARGIYQQIMSVARSVDHTTLDTGSPQAGPEPSVRDMARHNDDPETIGRTHARMVMAARQREAKQARESE